MKVKRIEHWQYLMLYDLGVPVARTAYIDETSAWLADYLLRGGDQQHGWRCVDNSYGDFWTLVDAE